MAKANVILLNSILWNLREITTLAEKIKKHCGDVDCASWRYPLTSCSQLEIFKLIENNRSLDSYTYILELTYDRLLYVFNLMIKFLESTDSSGKFRPDKYVVRPKTLSMASLLHMMWDRIRDRGESSHLVEVNPVEKEEVFRSTSSTYTQSEICSISVCSSCEMVQDFVTQLVMKMESILEKQEFASAIIEERNLMKDRLAETTSWSAMSRWLAAIIKDFSAVSEKAEEAEVTSRKLKRRLDSGEHKMKTKTEHLEEETRKMNGMIRERDSKIQEMKKQIDELTKEKDKVKQEINSKNLEMTQSTSNFEKKIEEEKKNYESKMMKIKEKHLKKQQDKEIEWKKKLEVESRSRRESERLVEKLQESAAKAEEELEAILSRSMEEKHIFIKQVNDMEEEIKSLREEKDELNLVVEAKQKKIDEYSSRILEAFPELNGTSKLKYKASGNPRIDMENQIEANKLRIELLISENEKLEKTLEKLKVMDG